MSQNTIHYLLQIADNALIQGHRISEWCGHGPVLEQDIALTNTALDHLGLARNTYQYIAELINELDKESQLSLFKSVQFNDRVNSGNSIAEDDIPYLRDAWDFRNVLLTEQSNQDWAYTVIRSFFYDHFMVILLSELSKSTDERIVAIAEKSLKEALYHKKWSSEWVIRLGDGTEESHKRIAAALENRWAYIGELFEDSAADITANKSLNTPLPSSLKEQWYNIIATVLEEATLTAPALDVWMQTGGKNGTHSEHLGFILTDLQFMQRAYPGMSW